MFKQGTKWIRADFHLHTRVDKEFSYSGEDNRFVSDYVEKLKVEGIDLGVITNHNKFDLNEYKALKDKARKEDIMIFPGVELSVKEGANGIHCLIVFKDSDWINGRKESINSFLDETFKGIENRENENTRCNDDLPAVIKRLDTYEKEYFILMAHIEQKSGFIHECDGGLIKSLSAKTGFQKRVLGFQKGRTRDKMKQLNEWLGYKLPYIEGSDCKSIDSIGKGKKSFIKVGDTDFDSLVIAFRDFKNRISLEHKSINHGHIRSIEFLGGKLDGKKIHLSPELNSLIGIRGSGKSSVIEVIRYVLNISPSDSDKDYKNAVVGNLLNSGGQVIMEVQDGIGDLYKIKRILGENAHVTNLDNQEVGAKVGSVLRAPLYFGQKDLSAMDNGFELKLLDKLVGEKTESYKVDLQDLENNLSVKMKELLELESKINNGEELNKTLADVRHKIQIFEKEGVSEKLSKQVNFQQDWTSIKNAVKLTRRYKGKLEKLLNVDELNELPNFRENKSEEVSGLFGKLSIEIGKVTHTKSSVQEIINEVAKSEQEMSNILVNIQATMKSLEEDFAKIKREIDIPNLNPDDFSKLKAQEEKTIKSIEEISVYETKKNEIIDDIRLLVNRRNETLAKELRVYEFEISKINSCQNSLDLTIVFKGNKEYFLQKLKKEFKGTGISASAYENFPSLFSDFTMLVTDVLVDGSSTISTILTEAQLDKIKKNIIINYDSYIKIATPNQIEIKYHGKSIIKHSMGQRASALVLFILSQNENNLIMIDQPEDDLDNQVIYNEIIKEIKIRKPDVQFIFATHNANIPVLGDSEQVIAVTYNEEKMDIETGSVDRKSIQNKIVDIMEGGQEAFNRRTEIYNVWKN
ncbi:TrlF family AAA-like ATPase [Listeria rocourtiae]|uniref:TrlF family AAA-like ATPase n=1 Tax=Listeria rocourtiae TaxID=647910 RepID=UPI001C8A9E32|nr:hypothetical protein [Listeria rocourtiae]